MSLDALPASLLNAADSLRFYEQMILLRRFELTVQDNYKKGRMPGFLHLYIGQEAVAVGVCAHLRRDDWITSTHRGHGHALAKGVPPRVVMAELYGRTTGCNGGRGGSMHLYEPDWGLLGTNGFVGGGIPSAVGTGLSARVRGTDGVGVAFFGDGATGHGAFHESINLAGALDAPVVFVCENNLYATATPLAKATKNIDIASRAAAYGIPGISVDGNDLGAVWQATREAVERARSGGGPTLVEARTYRTVGHHEGDPLVGTYRTQQELDGWKTRDPLIFWRHKLVDEGVPAAQLQEIDARIDEIVRDAVQFAESSPQPDASTANDHVWAIPFSSTKAPSAGNTAREQSWLDAVRDGIAEEMRRDPNIIYLGEGIGERGGSFAHTKGLWAEFGENRVIDTPICELGFTGAAAGAAATGCTAIADLMFADFLFESATQIIQQAAKLRYMSNGRLQVPLVVRSGMGAIKNAGPHHSGTYYPIWAHNPGLIVVAPSNPADAKGLWKTALRTGDPVIMLEHKMLFGTKGMVPEGEHFVPFGVASVARQGRDLTLVSCGLLLHRCLEAAKVLEQQGISCEVIDLRTLVPLDVETVAQSVAKTGRLLIVDEAFSMCGVGAELCAAMMELAFDELDAPIGRLHTDPVAQPFSPNLEDAVVVSVEKIVEAAKSVAQGIAPMPRRAPVATGTSLHETAPPVEVKGAVSPRQAEANSDALEERMTDLVDEAAASSTNRSSTSGGVALQMPNVDLTITEATIARWMKQIGQRVEAGEAVLEAESTKAVYEVEAPASGILVSVDAPEGATVKIGQQLGLIQAD